MGSSPEITDTWYARPGSEQDVVVSTAVELHRNLANFPFPERLDDSDGARVMSIVFDAFNRLEDSERYQTVAANLLDSNAFRIMRERNILPSDEYRNAGIILRSDGKVSCTVNCGDHVRIASFFSGMDFDRPLVITGKLDSDIQHFVQFAASYDFGYLTSSIADCGSGMRLSFSAHLPSLCMLGRIRSLSEEVAAAGFSMSAEYASGGAGGLSGRNFDGSALGGYYRISSTNCISGTEFDQVASIIALCKKVIDAERAAREECRRTVPSSVQNYMYRAASIARSSVFVTLREAIEITGGVKWALDMGFLSGINETDLHSLLYRIQEGHLRYVLDNGKFKFEDDVSGSEDKKIERLRALILQEAFENLQIQHDSAR